MKRGVLFILVLTVVTIFLALSVAQQESKKEESQLTSSSPIILTNLDLKWSDAGTLPPGAKLAILEGDPAQSGLFTMRAKFPANYKIPPHWHPVDEHLTVLSGTYNIGLGERFDKKTSRELPAGSFVVMPAKTYHFAWTKVETVIQVHSVGPWGINYLNPDEDPRIIKNK